MIEDSKMSASSVPITAPTPHSDDKVFVTVDPITGEPVVSLTDAISAVWGGNTHAFLDVEGGKLFDVNDVLSRPIAAAPTDEPTQLQPDAVRVQQEAHTEWLHCTSECHPVGIKYTHMGAPSFKEALRDCGNLPFRVPTGFTTQAETLISK